MGLVVGGMELLCLEDVVVVCALLSGSSFLVLESIQNPTFSKQCDLRAVLRKFLKPLLVHWHSQLMKQLF